MLPLGEICALLAPLTWSVAVILFKQSDGPPALSLNLFKNVAGIGLLGLTMLAVGIGIPHDRPLVDWVRLGVSGLVGLALADTMLFEGLRRVGAARLAVVDTIYAPLVVFLAWAVLGEPIGGAFLIGAIAVIAGVTLATVQRGVFVGIDGRERAIGMLYCLGAIGGTAIGVVIAKPALAASNLVELTCTRLLFGVAGQVVWITLTRQWSAAGVAFRPQPLWRSLIPAAIMGPYISLLLWLGGFKWAPASVAAVLNQMATVYILVLARVVLKEHLSGRQATGATIAAGGAVWIVWSRAG